MSPGSGVDGSLSLTDVFRMSDYTSGPGDAMFKSKLSERRGYDITSMSILASPFDNDVGIVSVDVKINRNERAYTMLLRKSPRGVMRYRWYPRNDRPEALPASSHLEIGNHAAKILRQFYGLDVREYDMNIPTPAQQI